MSEGAQAPEPRVTSRPAVVSDAPAMLRTARLAQAKLAASGSAQRLAGHDPENVAVRIAAGHAHALTYEGAVVGTAFIEPVTAARHSQVRSWAVADSGTPLLFLYGLVLRPAWQGRGLGEFFLRRVCEYAVAPGTVLVLDCWAGNEKLREFYARAGFRLHGEYPEGDYSVAVFTWRR